MSSERVRDFGFAAASDVPIPYLERARTYYAALGFGAPYEWAHFAQVPFHRLAEPLASLPRRARDDGRAVPARQGDQGPGAPYNARRQVLSRSTRATRDRTPTCASATSPSIASTRAAKTGDLVPARGAAPRCRGRPDRRRRATLPWRADQPQPARDAEADGAEIVARCRADAVDAAILVANCPVCHQTSSLIAECSSRTASPPS